jgi:hypothetical protein
MRLHRFTDKVPAETGRALAEFEREFSYPLGPSERFRISHGEDYLPFFRAIGEPVLLVMEDAGRIVGGIVRVRRRLELRREAKSVVEDSVAHYLCDLKVAAAARGTRVLARMIGETKREIEASDSRACYCVVMAGTGRLPTDYTGRLGVPRFERVGEIVILRISPGGLLVKHCRVISIKDFAEVRGRLARTGYTATGGESAYRSWMAPLPLVTPDGDACGLLEDTRRGKRLWLESGGELVSEHLSGFAYATPEAGAELLAAAVVRAQGPFFVALPVREMEVMRPLLEGLEFTEARACIYGHGLESGHDWWVDTAEI